MRHERLQLPDERVKTVLESNERARAAALRPAGRRAAPSSCLAGSQTRKMKNGQQRNGSSSSVANVTCPVPIFISYHRHECKCYMVHNPSRIPSCSIFQVLVSIESCSNPSPSPMSMSPANLISSPSHLTSSKPSSYSTTFSPQG